MGDCFSRCLGIDVALKMAAEAGAARLEAPMSAAVTRLENAASAHGDKITTALDDCTTRLATALDKTAMKACALLLLAITILRGCGAISYGQQ